MSKNLMFTADDARQTANSIKYKEYFGVKTVIFHAMKRGEFQVDVHGDDNGKNVSISQDTINRLEVEGFRIGEVHNKCMRTIQW